MVDIPANAATTGGLGNAALIEAIAECAKSFSFPLIVDPVMVSKRGAVLIDDDAVDAFTHKLLPNTFLLTPNLHEAAKLNAMEITDVCSMERAAAVTARFGVANVLVKGGHLDGDAVDVLWTEGLTQRLFRDFRGQRGQGLQARDFRRHTPVSKGFHRDEPQMNRPRPRSVVRGTQCVFRTRLARISPAS